MKYFIVFGIFFSTLLSAFAQDYTRINELKKSILQHPSDTSSLRDFFETVTVNTDIHKDSSQLYLLWLFEQTENNKQHLFYAKSALTLGERYTTLGNYSKALAYLLIAEKEFTLLNDYSSLGTVYSTIGNTYLGLQKPKEQKVYFQKCYELGDKYNIDKFKAYGAGGLANYYVEIKNYKKSNEWNEIAVKFFDEMNIPVGSAIIRINMASNYRMLNDLTSASKTIKQAETITKKLQFNYASYLCFKEKGDIDMELNKVNSAILNYQKALDLILQDKANHNISEAYKSLSKAYEVSNQYQQSLKFLKLHMSYKDSVFNEENNKQLVEIKEKYETEQKDAEIKILNQENRLNKADLNQKKTVIFAVLIGVSLLGILILFLIRSNITKNKNNTLLGKQKQIIEEKQKEIVDSINYAKRIQFTLLASDKLLSTQLKEHFVFFEPKDIVSGDFYWGITIENRSFIAVCDCTGHGVPGAFMSLLNINFLNEAITEKRLTKPGEIFDFVRQRLLENLKNEGAQDGMDGILLSINHANNEVTYAAANSRIIRVSNNQSFSSECDRMPVGKGVNTDSFRTFTLETEKNDVLYLSTDGFADQFGGPKGKKYMHKKLKNYLLSIHDSPFMEQREQLKNTFIEWKGDVEQVDDICIIGLKI